MARVDGFTKERMLAIENTCIVSGAVVLDNLQLTQRDGTVIDAGNVRGPQGDQGIQGIQGIQGVPGTDGLDAAITGATAAGLAAGSAPTVDLGGTPQARTFAFGIPQGAKGDKGDPGTQGIDGSAAMPAGTIALWASDTAPTNWLICDGSAVSRTTYASLFAAIGTSYGAGDGVNTFNLPNLKGQTPIGKDAAQTEFSALNQKGGEKKHLLTAAESGLPAHNHTQNSHTHTTLVRTAMTYGTTAGTSLFAVDNSGNTPTGATTATNNPNAAADAAQAHNILQPYTVVNFIIKVTNGDSPNDSQLTQRVSTLESWMGQTPAGTITVFGGDTAPTNWLLCDGSAVSRSTYASLFAVIGTKYGAGDGSTTFNLPNLKGRVPVGRDAAQTEFATLGQNGGSKTHRHYHASQVGKSSANIYVIDPTDASQDAFGADTSFNYIATTSFGPSSGPGSGGLEIHRVSSSIESGLPPYLTANYIIKFTNGDTQGDSQLTQRVTALENNATQSARIDKKIARLQASLAAGGIGHLTDGTFAWTQKFELNCAIDDLTPTGYFVINMPPNGTVIPVVGHATVKSLTVVNGVIDVTSLSGYCQLYYDVPMYSTDPSTQYGRFLMVDGGVAATIPQTCVLLMTRVVDANATQWKWGTGRMQDFWHTMSLLNGWVNYDTGGTYAPAGYKIAADGDIVLRGLIKNGNTGSIASMPLGYRPQYAAIFTQVATGGVCRIDASQNGDLGLTWYAAGGSNGYVSLEGIRWTPYN